MRIFLILVLFFIVSQAKLKKKCPEGLVKDEDGDCVCPDGQEFVEDDCVDMCRDDQIRLENGECACESNKVEWNDECVSRCRKDQVRDDDGKCGCAEGKENYRSKCVKICGKQQKRNKDGNCICKNKNDEMVKGDCKAKCTGGQIRNTDNKQCECPEGQVLVNGECSDQVCRDDQVRNSNGECECPHGQVDYEDVCYEMCKDLYFLNQDGLCVTDQIRSDDATPSELTDYQILYSKNLKYFCEMQHDGNFVCRENNAEKEALFSTKTQNRGISPYKMYMQPDGNLVVYNKMGRATWASNTMNKGEWPWSVVVTNEGKLDIMDKNGFVTKSFDFNKLNLYPYKQLDNCASDHKRNDFGQCICENYWEIDYFGKCIMQCPQFFFFNTHGICVTNRLDSDDITDKSISVLNEHEKIYSRNNKFVCMMQRDGNFICRPNDNDGETGKPVFSTDTYKKGKGPYQLIMQKDGNLVLYQNIDVKPKPTYVTGTSNKGSGPWSLHLTDEGILEILDSTHEQIWKSIRMDKTANTDTHRDL